MMNTWKSRSYFLAVVLVLVTTASVFALDPFYEQNGDAYMLIGDGPARGVYRLNSLTTGVPDYLYNPQDAYGLSASMRMSGPNMLKELWTFSAWDTGWKSPSSALERQVLTTNYVSANIWTENRTLVRNAITHNHHQYPNHTPTGVGTHVNAAGCYPRPYCEAYGFYNQDYPCTWMPTAVPGRPGFFYVNNNTWYHSGDPADVVWSNYTYSYDWWGTSSPNTLGAYGSYGFVGCHCGWGLGGYGHWLKKDNVQVKERNLELWNFNATANSGPSNLRRVATVVTAENVTTSRLNECGDPCAPGSGTEVRPGGEVPWVDCLVSGAGRDYFYSRPPSRTNYTLLLNSVNYGGSVIGNPADLTTKNLGVSSRDTTRDWVYTLGVNVLNAWFALANAPFRLNELTDVAVSDQWWQTGGIVYAYDRTQGMAYKVVRKESTGAISLPETIPVFDGWVMPDSISADGFGNLYLVKTVREPDNAPGNATPNFVVANAYGYYKKSPMVANLFAAQFLQRVYKGVMKRDYYSGSIGTLPGRVLLGINYFERDFTCDPADILDRSKWVFASALRRTTPDVNTNYRTELAVINVATPPRVSNANAKIDINGPAVLDSTNQLITAPSPYNDTTTYYFSVENAPSFDENGVNILGNANQDVNGNSFLGVFPSTAKESALKYYWRIIQTKDRYGQGVSNVVLDGTAPTDSPILPVLLSGGEYEIAVRSTYQYYDYDLLPRGALSDQKETVLSAVRTAVAKDTTQWSKFVFTIETVPPVNLPGGAGIIMSGRPLGGTSYQYRPSLVTVSNPWSSESPNENSVPLNPAPDRYVIPQVKTGQDWSFQLRENLGNMRAGKNRIDLMHRINPPDPADPRMVPGTLEWTNDVAYNWTILLPDPAGGGTPAVVDVARTLATPTMICSAGGGMFTTPSEPGEYALKVQAQRSYSYKTYIPRILPLPGGGVTTQWILTPIFKTIQIGAETPVIVLDNTAPGIVLTDPADNSQKQAMAITPTFLYGTTGEDLTSRLEKTNPTNITFIVADDNPYGNVRTHVNLSPAVADRYFSYQVKHMANKRVASFSYTTATDTMVPQDLPAAAISPAPRYRNATSTDSTANGLLPAYCVQQFDHVATTLPASPLIPQVRSWSYRRYEIGVADLDHFQQDAAGTSFAPNLPIHWANNLPQYENLRYGFGISDASGNATGPIFMGEIVIRDNDRPNVFLIAEDEKTPGVSLAAPSNVDPTFYRGGWTWFDIGDGNAPYNGQLSWDFGADILNPVALTEFDAGYRRVSANTVRAILADEATNGSYSLEIDVPVIFSMISNDNVGVTTRLAWSLKDSTGALVADMGLAARYRQIFRTGGNYQAEIQIRDDALDWPTDPRVPRVAPPKYNLRTLKAVIPISSSRLDVRIIEKNVR